MYLPGVLEKYVINGTFDVWNASGGVTAHGYSDTEEYDDVAYPWEPVPSDGDVRYQQMVGGVRGRGVHEGLVEGVDIPDGQALDPPGVTRRRHQRLSVEGPAGVRQRIVFPDRWVSGYDVRLSVRGSLDECVVSPETATQGTEPVARQTIPVEDAWERHEIELTLDGESPERYGTAPYGEYFLTIASAGGPVDVDWVTAIPGDAVEGVRELTVTTLRWPGGNYASQYRWRHGVGPIEDRPVTGVVNWGGLDPNYLGTNEWLRFCELVDAEPYVSVPVWDPTGPEEAAAWVEYCNGSIGATSRAVSGEGRASMADLWRFRTGRDGRSTRGWRWPACMAP